MRSRRLDQEAAGALMLSHRGPGGAAPRSSGLRVLGSIGLVLLLCSAAGCFGTTRIYYSESSKLNPRPMRVTKTVRKWVWGLIDSSQLNMGSICGMNGVGEIEVEQTGGDWLAFAASLGLYTPTTVRLACEGVEEPSASPRAGR